MNFDDAIRAYCDFLTHELHASESTRLGYQAYLRRFNRFLIERHGAVPQLAEVTTDDVRSYLYRLSREGLRPRTLRGAIYPIRGLFGMAVERQYIGDNPAKAVKLPKKDAAVRESASDEQLEQLLAGCERERDPQRRAMLRALLSVLIYGGLRRQETLDLQVGDIDLKKGQLLVRSGKGSKSRAIFPCQACLQAIRDWLEVRPKSPHSYLFTVDRRRRLGEEGLRRLVEQAKSLADLRDHENIKPHAMRHAAATRLLRNGADLRSIQNFLGHSCLQTTAMYLHTDEQQLQRIAELGTLGDAQPAASPRSGQAQPGQAQSRATDGSHSNRWVRTRGPRCRQPAQRFGSRS